MNDADLFSFIKESNRIEGISQVRPDDVKAHRVFLTLDEPRRENVCDAVWALAREKIRDKPGMNVRVGNHYPHGGGKDIPEMLDNLLRTAVHSKASDAPHAIHHWYETLHPFMEGNGRSGRLLWLWMHLESMTYMGLGFLHQWYYESLQARRGPDEEEEK